jgi:microcin C transport system substrate-binding protein
MRALATILSLSCLTAGFLILATPVQASGPIDGVPGVHGAAMHGAPKYGPDFKHFEYANPNAPKGGTQKLSSIGTYDSFNGYIIKGVSAAGLGWLNDTLMSASSDEAFSQYGRLAEKIHIPKDRSWVGYTLRKEARWHDGKPVTPEDIIFSLNILKEKGSPQYRYYYKNVVKVEKIGSHQVKFTFSEGENRELPLIVGQFPIFPKHYWATRNFEKTTLEPPLGSGPYKIKSFDAGRSITYERVQDYWGQDIPVQRGANNPDIIRIDYYRDSTVALEAFKAGEYDFREERVSKNWATAYNIPQIRDGVIKKEQIRHYSSTGMQSFVFNLRRDLFKDSRVRQALTFAFDFEWTNKNLFYGQYTRSHSYFSNSELAADKLPGPDEQKILEPFRGKVPDAVFTKVYRAPTNDGSGNIRRNLRTAIGLLKDAGWVFKDRKLINAKTGKQFSFQILLASPNFERIVLPFVRNLKRMGVAATVRTVDPAQYQKRTETFDYDIIVGSWGQSLSPGNEQRNYWGVESAKRQGSRNLIGVENPVLDKLIDLVIAAPDRKQLILRTRALDRVLLWNHYVIPQWHIQSFRVAYWDKFSRPEITPKYALGFNFWWIDSKKSAAVNARQKKK